MELLHGLARHAERERKRFVLRRKHVHSVWALDFADASLLFFELLVTESALLEPESDSLIFVVSESAFSLIAESLCGWLGRGEARCFGKGKLLLR